MGKLGESKKQRALNLISQGKDLAWVVSHENVSVTALRRWIKESQFAGSTAQISGSSEFLKHSTTLTPSQLKWIQFILLNKTPKSFGLRNSFWMGNTFDKVIKEWCNKDIHISESYKLFKFLEFEIPEAELKSLAKIRNLASSEIDTRKVGQTFFVGNYSSFAKYKVVTQPSGKGSIIIKNGSLKPAGTYLFAFQRYKGSRFVATSSALSEEIVTDFIANLIDEVNDSVILIASKDSIFAQKGITDYFARNYFNSKIIIR